MNGDLVDEFKKLLRGPLSLEKRQEFQNRSVEKIGFGGYCKNLLLKLIPNLETEEKRSLLPLLEKAGSYGIGTLPFRKQFVSQMENIFSTSLKGESPQPVKPLLKKLPTELPPTQSIVSPPKPPKSTPKKILPQGDIINLSEIPGLGPKTESYFSSIGINSPKKLLHHYPLRYEDRKDFTDLNKESVWDGPRSYYGIIRQSRPFGYGKKGGGGFQILLDCGDIQIKAAWFHMGFLAKTLKVGTRMVCFGVLNREKNQLTQPPFEIIPPDQEKGETLHFGRIVPIYSFPPGHGKPPPQKNFREWVHFTLSHHPFADPFPIDFLLKNHLFTREEAFKNIHFPKSSLALKGAKRRFAFEDLFFFLEGMKRLKKEQKSLLKAVQLDGEALKIEIGRGIQTLPFPLTGDQQRALGELQEDLLKDSPMRRLIQGDVGCGKTVLPLLLARGLKLQGGQTLLMAPTSILATQHFELFSEGGPFTPLGLKVALLTSSTPKKGIKEILHNWEKGEIDLLIGTHALLFQELDKLRVQLIVIDEQQKFGVEQRVALSRSIPQAHLMFLSATPIPRTLALSLYGYLEVSHLKEKPGNRGRMETQWIKSPKMEPLLDELRKNKKRGEKSFFLSPLIEESEFFDMIPLKERLAQLKKDLPEFKIDFLHGKLSEKEKDRVVGEFKTNQLDLIVVTSVIEVGIDIPGATLLIVENAEKFGLSQLHQMRGRLGRRGEDSKCLLWSSHKEGAAAQRLEIFCKIQDGFLLAEEDLKIRGPGELFGLAQSGVPRSTLSFLLTEKGFLDWVKKMTQEIEGDFPELQKEVDHLFESQEFKGFFFG